MPILLAALAAFAGLAFWRRHTLKDDAAKAAAAGKDAASKAAAAGKDAASKVNTRVRGDGEAEGQEETGTDATDEDAESVDADASDESE